MTLIRKLLTSYKFQIPLFIIGIIGLLHIYPEFNLVAWTFVASSVTLMLIRLRNLPYSIKLLPIGIPLLYSQLTDFLYSSYGYYPPALIANTSTMFSKFYYYWGWSDVRVTLYILILFIIPLACVSFVSGYMSNLTLKKNSLITVILFIAMSLSSSMFAKFIYVGDGYHPSSLVKFLPILVGLSAFPIIHIVVQSKLFESSNVNHIENKLLAIASRGDGTISETGAAEELGISPDEVRNILKSMEDRGIIRL